MSINDFADKFAIQENLQRYMMAIDAADRKALRAVFADDARMELLAPVGPDEYCDFVLDIMTKIKTNHILVNTVTDLNGDTASSMSYFWAYHRVPGHCDDPACVQIFGRFEEETDVFHGGYYFDESVRTSRGWKIRSRKVQAMWQQYYPSKAKLSDKWFAAQPWFSQLN